MSCVFGREIESQCTPSRADDCGSKGVCGVWDKHKKRDKDDLVIGDGSECQCEYCRERNGR